MDSKKKNRKYYLHRVVKPFCRVNVRARTIFATQETIDKFTARQKAYTDELKQDFNYSLQIEIPPG